MSEVPGEPNVSIGTRRGEYPAIWVVKYKGIDLLDNGRA